MSFWQTVFEDMSIVDSCIFPIDSYTTGFRCVWTIHDYMEVKEQVPYEECVEIRPVINLSFDKTCKYGIALYPNGYNSEDNYEACFGFCKMECDIKETSYLKLSLLNSESQPILSQEFAGVENDQWWGFLSLHELCNSENDFLVNGSLFILLEGAVSTKINTDERKTEIQDLLQEKLENLNVALKQLKYQNKYSDVSFTVGEEQFELHKNVLASKSEVFDKMFSDQNELQNIIPIRNVTPDVFSEMVHFIYTNSVTRNFHDMALVLIKAADLYEIPQLKKLCEKYLMSSIDVENVAKSLLVAYNHSSDNLKKKCSEVIREKWDGIQETDGWEEVRSNPEILFYLMNDTLSLNKK